MATAGWVGTAVASSTAIAAEFDPTTTPTRASFWAFLFMAVALVLLMLSMVRHLRRARENLGSEREAADPRSSESAQVTRADSDEPSVPDQPR